MSPPAVTLHEPIAQVLAILTGWLVGGSSRLWLLLKVLIPFTRGVAPRCSRANWLKAQTNGLKVHHMKVSHTSESCHFPVLVQNKDNINCVRKILS